MLQTKQRIESILFDYETTYRTDYPFGKLREYPKTVYKEKPSKRVRGAPQYRNIHTMSPWRGDMPPFGLLHKPKEVVRTNPNNVQQRYEKLFDERIEEAKKTRPRLVMTPAVSMDDIEDPRARDILCSEIYASSMSNAFNLAISSNVKAPLPGRLAPSNPIALPKLQPPLVSAEWRMDSVEWDGWQLRSHCDPTKEFWVIRNLPKCKACEETAVVRALRQKSAKTKKNI